MPILKARERENKLPHLSHGHIIKIEDPISMKINIKEVETMFQIYVTCN